MTNPSTQISRKSAQASSTRSATFGGFGGNPSIPSIEADGAKMEGRANARPDRAAKAGIYPVNSKQAANQFLETAAWALAFIYVMLVVLPA
ncbi:hypothetical protein EJ076_34900 [Mesorhizobium sp. M7D.F.Ca.US.005.01.1.1]|uniref:hypothetical protein n=1 Tax=Mesorhizobium sp. M7D.F.Ca.US.005.01.1.1 TaxID=2493678 RepID=UPI000F74D549|nr:hypothetical protein [Mesorhizobium sp. M7D.F.Ca.US.005.01.1.1]AZO45906.1 hypothetical protein EJ076_34900 [Mesorhizobium sp. M7D.F.Ca.US.005.01.1.1]